MKRAIILPGLVTAFVALSPVAVALAANPHSGQPAVTAVSRARMKARDLAARPQHGGFVNVGSQHYAGSATIQIQQHSQGREPIRLRRLPVGPAPPGGLVGPAWRRSKPCTAKAPAVAADAVDR